MINEKIKKYGLGAMVFMLNLLLAAGGVFYLKSRDAKKSQENEHAMRLAAQAQADAVNAQAQVEATIVQDGIYADRQAKLESIARNSGKVTEQQPQKTVQVIPPKTVTTTKPTVSTSTSTKTTKTS